MSSPRNLPTASAIDHSSRLWALAATIMAQALLVVCLAHSHLMEPAENPDTNPDRVSLCLAFSQAEPAETVAPAAPARPSSRNQAAPPKPEPAVRESMTHEPQPPLPPPREIKTPEIEPPKPKPPVVPQKKQAPAVPATPPAKPVQQIPSATPVPAKSVTAPVETASETQPPTAASPSDARGSLAPQATASGGRNVDPLLAALARLIDRYKSYPKSARRARLEGVVRVRVTIDQGGTVRSFVLAQGSGHGVLDRATLKTFERISGRKISDSDLARSLEIVVPVRYEHP